LIDGELLLRHRRPVSHPYPNKYSHPLPRFCFHSDTGNVTVAFSTDPAYPDIPNPTTGAWRNKTYYLTSIPERQPRGILDDAADAIAHAFSAPLSLFSSSQHLSAVPEPGAAFDLRNDEYEEQERPEDAEVDDAEEMSRKVRMVGTTAEEDRRLGTQARVRRVWEILPLRTVSKRTGN
jgi:WD repeat-containing protein 23